MRVDNAEFSQILSYCKLLAKNVDQLTQYVMLLEDKSRLISEQHNLERASGLPQK